MHPIGVIVYETGLAIDGLLGGIVPGLRAAGLRLGGLVQRNDPDAGGRCVGMMLEDLATGRLYAISEPRGTQAAGCRLDTAGLAAAAPFLLGAQAPDLVLVNKFGKQEALGRGLRDEIAAVIIAGVPLLTAVRADFLPAWRDFAGTDWERLPVEAAAAAAWAVRVARPAPAPAR